MFGTKANATFVANMDRTYHCPLKKVSPNKLIWVPKGTTINSMQHDKQFRSMFEAPKSKWVPKKHPFL